MPGRVSTSTRGDLVAQQLDVARDAVVHEPVDHRGRGAEPLGQVVDDLRLRLALVPADHLARLAAAPQLGEVRMMPGSVRPWNE